MSVRTGGWLHRLSLATLTAIAAIISSGGAMAADPILIRMTVDNPPATPRAAAEEYFAAQVDKLSNGAMKVQLFWSGALGGVQKAALDTVRAGGAEIAAISTSNFSTMNRTWALFDMPFVFDGPQALYKFMDSPEFDALKKDAVQKQGVRYMFTWYDNWRHLVTTKRPILVPDEMKGAKLRTTGSPIETAYDVAFGAKPTAVDWGETYLALKNGLVDGYFIGYTTITNFKQNDAVKYGTTLNVVPIVVGMFLNEGFYQKLSPAHRKALDDAARLAELADRKVDEDNDKASRKQLQGEGFVIHDPSPAEKALWVARAKPVYAQFENTFPAGLITKIQAIR